MARDGYLSPFMKAFIMITSNDDEESSCPYEFPNQQKTI